LNERELVNQYSSLQLLETYYHDGAFDVGLEAVYARMEASRVAGNIKILRLGESLTSEDVPRNPAEYSIPSLAELSLHHWDVPEERLLQFLRACPNIKRLDVSGTRATGVLVKELMTRESGPLEMLGVIDCRHLSQDAVAYARSMGAVVHHYMTADSKPRRAWRDRF
jgi:F-box/TPR repeat protein Pof3